MIPEQLPNILVIVIDALRYDHVSYAGYDRQTTPHLDALAQEGTFYTNMYTSAPWTLPSITSLLTGHIPSEHGLSGLNPQLPLEVPSLPEIMRNHGYETFAISNNVWFSSFSGLDRGFEGFHNLSRLFDDDADTVWKQWLERAYQKYLYIRSDDGVTCTNRLFLRWLANRATEQPYCAWLHYMEPHAPYSPPQAWRSRFRHKALSDEDIISLNCNAIDYVCGLVDRSEEELQALIDLYDSEIAYLDHHIGRLIQSLRSRQLLDDTLLIVTADHGEHIGDNGLMGHQYSLSDRLIHVPFLIRYPGSVQDNEVDTRMFQLTDVFCTLCNLVGAHDERGDNANFDLLAGHEGRTWILAEYLDSDPERITQRDATQDVEKITADLRAVRDRSHKLVWRSDGSYDFYNLTVDSKEANDISGTKPNKERWMLDILQTIETKSGGVSRRPETDNVMRERLRRLGYL